MRTRKRKRRGRERGFSLLEATLAVAFVGVLALVYERTLAAAHDTDQYLDAVARSQELARRASFKVYRRVACARTVFGLDTRGESYLAMLDLGDRLPIATARLPVIDEEHPLGPDLTGAPHTGNILLFAMEIDPIACATVPQESETRTVDVYRFVCCYLHEPGRQVITEGARPARDLVVWASEPFASYPQVQGIEVKNDQMNVIRRLYKDHGMNYVWDPTALAGEAFYKISISGTVEKTPSVDPLIPEDPTYSEGGVLVYANAQAARSDPSARMRRPVFTASELPHWAPDGFEVKIAGPSGHRKVWFHLAVETQAARGRAAVSTSTLVASVQDF